MIQPAFAFTDPVQGEALAKEGMDRAIEHADRKVDAWSDIARGFLTGFVQQNARFTCEEVWLAAEAAGIPRPPDRRAWGGILRGAAMRGLIQKLPVPEKSIVVHNHGQPVAVYERRIA